MPIKKKIFVRITYFVTISLTLVNIMTKDVHASKMFSIKKLSTQDISLMLKNNVLKKPYLYNPDRLRILNISYYDFQGNVHKDGKMVVLDAASKKALDIFKELFDKEFSLQRVGLMNEFEGDDELAMKANNSSALNQRPIAGSDQLSIHSYGLAIDINPVQNPYIVFNYKDGSAQYFPSAGIEFANRSENRMGKEKRGGLAESVIDIFYKNGLNIWGGNWDEPTDYQHFQTSRSLAELLVKMDSTDAEILFNAHVEFLKLGKSEELLEHAQKNIGSNLTSAYLADKQKFISQINKIISDLKSG